MRILTPITRTLLILILLNCMIPGSFVYPMVSDTVDIATPQPKRQFKPRILVDFGFGHWTSDRFRTAVLGKDFGFGISVNPGIPYLQVKGRYDFSTIRTTEGDTVFSSYDGKHIGFTTFELGGFKEFKAKVHSLLVSASGGVVLIGIEDRDLVTGISAGVGVNYLFRNPDWKRLGIGISLNILSRTYNITDEKAEFIEWITADKEILDRDLNLILGVAVYW